MTSKIMPCLDCGKELPRKELNRRLRCRDCALKAMIDSANQLYRHEGPYYERWVKSHNATPEEIERRAEIQAQRWLDSLPKTPEEIEYMKGKIKHHYILSCGGGGGGGGQPK